MAFKEKFLAAIDKRSSQARDLMSNFNDILDDIDWETKFDELNQAKKSLLRRGSELFDEMNDFLQEIKESITDFSVTVPFDSTSGEKYNYEIKDNNWLVVTVSYDDGMTRKNNVTEAKIPQECDIEKLNVDVNSNSLVITIPKKVNVTSDTVNHIENDETVGQEPNVTKKKKKTQSLTAETKASIEQIARKVAEKSKGHKSIFGAKHYTPRVPKSE